MSQENEPTIDLELQARIIAMVLGEASDMECEQLQGLIEQREELAVFVKEITEVDDLMREVVALQADPPGTSESSASEPATDTFAELADWDAGQWKLSSDRRQNVLAAIESAPKGIAAATQSTASGDLQSAAQDALPVWQNKRNLLRWISIAASVLALASVSVFMLLPSYRQFAAFAPTDSRRYRSVTMANDAQALVEDNAIAAKAFLYDIEEAPTTAIDGALAEPQLDYKSTAEGDKRGAIIDSLHDQRFAEQAESVQIESARGSLDDSFSMGSDKFIAPQSPARQSADSDSDSDWKTGTKIVDLESRLSLLNKSAETESRSRYRESDGDQPVRGQWRRERFGEAFGEPSSGDGGQPSGPITKKPQEALPATTPSSGPVSNFFSRATTEGKATLPTPDYLADDVQYLPAGPQMKLAPEATARVAQKAEHLQRQSQQQAQQGQATGLMSRPGLGVNGPGTNDLSGNQAGGFGSVPGRLGINDRASRSLELSDETTRMPVDLAAPTGKTKRKGGADRLLGDVDNNGDGIMNAEWMSKHAGNESSFGVNGATGGVWMDSGIQSSQPNQGLRFAQPTDGYAGLGGMDLDGITEGGGNGGGIGGGQPGAPPLVAGFAPGNDGPMGGSGGANSSGANRNAIISNGFGGGGFGGGGGGMGGGGGAVELNARVSNADMSLSLDALGAVANQPITGTATNGRVSGRDSQSADATEALIVGGIVVDSNGHQPPSSASGGEKNSDSMQLSDRDRLPAVVAGTPPVPTQPSNAAAPVDTPATTDLFAMGLREVERSASEFSSATQPAKEPAAAEVRELEETLKSQEAVRGIIRDQRSALRSKTATDNVEKMLEQFKEADESRIVEFETESLSGELDKLSSLSESKQPNETRYQNSHWGGVAGRGVALPQPAKPESGKKNARDGNQQRWDFNHEAGDSLDAGQAGEDSSRDFYSYAEKGNRNGQSMLEGEIAEGIILSVPLERRLKMLDAKASHGEADGKPTDESIRGKGAKGVPLGWRIADISFDDNVDFDVTFERDGQAVAGKDVSAKSRRIKESFGFQKQSQAAEKKDAQRTAGLNETSASEEPFSTFSLHVSDVAFKLARTALSQGQWPAGDKIRIEEFVNALDYSDPNPSQDSKVACQLEQCVHPFLQQRNLMRVSMRTAASGRSMATPLSLTLVLDHSGSMERADRRRLLTEALSALAKQLKPTDKVTLISFARTPRLVAEQIAGNQTDKLLQQVIQQPIEGGTNLEAALELAYEKAREGHRSGQYQSRIVLLTDGAVNLGDADPESLQKRVIQMRQSGIAFDAAGISANGLNDEVLETLTRKGDGRYYIIDGMDESDDRFAQQVAGALRPAAKNVKVQVEFNPQRVGQYKLLGFEKHALKKEDFRNDKVDAAEMAAEEAGVAVYQFQVNPDGQGDIGSVSVRFQDLETGRMIEQRWPIPYQSHTSEMDQAAPSMQLAATAALFAAKLRGDAIGQTVDLKELFRTLQALPSEQRRAPRVAELIQMIQQAELIQ